VFPILFGFSPLHEQKEAGIERVIDDFGVVKGDFPRPKGFFWGVYVPKSVV
jgi:hypothetical protein